MNIPVPVDQLDVTRDFETTSTFEGESDFRDVGDCVPQTTVNLVRRGPALFGSTSFPRCCLTARWWSAVARH
eukprot:5130421-Pyramimonas_sp.AAC.1